MSFNKKIIELSQKIDGLVEHLDTEESTKTALVMPFIQLLGYDIFNPQEVMPEFTTDIGTKKGEKVDYAILRNNEMVMLVECKKAKASLREEHANQLYRYSATTKASIAILTNGLTYLFYTDLDEPNKMDIRPFLEFDLDNPRDTVIAEVSKLTKEYFDSKRMLNTASELKYTSEIKRILNQQFDKPDEVLVKFFFARVNPNGRFTAVAKQRFTELVKTALNQFISEWVSSRLRLALEDVSPDEKKGDNHTEIRDSSDDGIITTEEEIEGYHIVKAIVSEVIDPVRVVFRDTKSCMSVLLDDNRLKSICRLHFTPLTNTLTGLMKKKKHKGPALAVCQISTIMRITSRKPLFLTIRWMTNLSRHKIETEA